MFSRKDRVPKDPGLAAAWELIDGADVQGAIRRLRPVADEAELSELVRVVRRAAKAAGYDDLTVASTAVVDRPGQPGALYDFGYACIERGAPFLAVPALREGLRLAPDSRGLLSELVAALEREGRHGEAVAVLSSRGPLPDWPELYLLAYNAVMSGDLDLARTVFAGLQPPDEQWSPARERLARVFERADFAAAAGSLDTEDLRGWHFVLGGGLLCSVSPFGFRDGMNGRYAYVRIGPDGCLAGLRRLRSVLAATGTAPTTVSLLPDRDSAILGLAAGQVLGLPTVPFAPERPDTVVVAYDLSAQPVDLQIELFERPPGQVLYEHASCWTDPPAVAADACAVLAQTAVSPWQERTDYDADRRPRPVPADERPAAEVAQDIVAADPIDDGGDDDAPPDTEEALTAFATAVGSGWLRGSQRDPAPDQGPVRSSRFL